MNPISAASLWAYWSAPEMEANAIIFAHLAFALLLGFVVGYERNYHGRAAGMRTYGLVCMASAALTIIPGYTAYWFGGQAHVADPVPSQIIQGIVTGIGFLGAGVIMKEGFSISGLTTAASIWASSSIGILVGIGLYAAAIVLTLLAAGCMLYAGRLEQALPACPAIAVVVSIDADALLTLEELDLQVRRCGYSLAAGSVSISDRPELREWRFVVAALGREAMAPLPQLALCLRSLPGIAGVDVAPARN